VEKSRKKRINSTRTHWSIQPAQVFFRFSADHISRTDLGIVTRFSAEIPLSTSNRPTKFDRGDYSRSDTIRVAPIGAATWFYQFNPHRLSMQPAQVVNSTRTHSSIQPAHIGQFNPHTLNSTRTGFLAISGTDRGIDTRFSAQIPLGIANKSTKFHYGGSSRSDAIRVAPIGSQHRPEVDPRSQIDAATLRYDGAQT